MFKWLTSRGGGIEPDATMTETDSMEISGVVGMRVPAGIDEPRYIVDVRNAEGLGRSLAGERVIFHGVNKSGSLVMSDVLREGYFHAGRANQFVSHYHKAPLEYEDMLSVVKNTRTGHCLFIGHWLYGVADDTGDKLWVTQLRNPLPRIVSCYQWMKNKHEKRTGSSAGFPTLEKYVVTNAGKIQSQMIQFAPGGVRGKPGKAMSKQELRDNAIDALESRIQWFGIAEYFEESIFAFAHLCGLRSVVAWKKDTRNTGRQLISELSSHEVDLIRDIYSDDIAVYEHAKALFRRRIEKVDFGPSFPDYKIRCADEYKDRIL